MRIQPESMQNPLDTDTASQMSSYFLEGEF